MFRDAIQAMSNVHTLVLRNCGTGPLSTDVLDNHVFLSRRGRTFTDAFCQQILRLELDRFVGCMPHDASMVVRQFPNLMHAVLECPRLSKLATGHGSRETEPSSEQDDLAACQSFFWDAEHPTQLAEAFESRQRYKPLDDSQRKLIISSLVLCFRHDTVTHLRIQEYSLSVFQHLLPYWAPTLVELDIHWFQDPRTLTMTSTSTSTSRDNSKSNYLLI